jgi:carbonic anhydrase
MEKLIHGHREFLEKAFPDRRHQFQLLADRQAPETLFITCADSRIVPDLVLQSQPGDLFICRAIGNVVPRAGEPAGGIAATIEYAVQVLKVRHLIVCGHSDCGVIRALMSPQVLAGLESVRAWLKHVEPAWNHLKEIEENSNELTRHTALTQANVLVQLANLRTHDYIVRAVDEGRLQVHGWYYDILSGAILRYDDAVGKFLPLA